MTRGEGGVKNLKIKVTSFMDGPFVLFSSSTKFENNFVIRTNELWCFYNVKATGNRNQSKMCSFYSSFLILDSFLTIVQYNTTRVALHVHSIPE